jgi:hypothetical protein
VTHLLRRLGLERGGVIHEQDQRGLPGVRPFHQLQTAPLPDLVPTSRPLRQWDRAPSFSIACPQ